MGEFWVILAIFSRTFANRTSGVARYRAATVVQQAFA